MLREIEKALATKLAENGIKAEVYGREKRAYSIWRKMEPKRDDIAVKGLANMKKFFGRK